MTVMPRERKAPPLSKQALDFAPSILAIQERPPARLPRAVAYVVFALFSCLLMWAFAGKLDVVASAEGKLIPQTYVKIVQPADAGIVKEILVAEGAHVTAGQVLMRLDSRMAAADETTVRDERVLKGLQLRRIEAELGGPPLTRKPDDPAKLFQQVEAQYREHKQALQDSLDQAAALRTRAARDADAGRATLVKLQAVVPILQEQARSLADLAKDGYVAQSKLQDKQREYLEKANELKAQHAAIESLDAARAAADTQLDQIKSKYRSDLQNERVETQGIFEKLTQELAKQEHRSSLLQLRATQGGVVKELATHTIGTVVSPGTVLLSIVPEQEPLVAEVLVKNDDIGFIYPKQKVKVKLLAYPFEQYGMIDGVVDRIGPDANEDGSTHGQGGDPNAQVAYKAIVRLNGQQLLAQGKAFRLVPGMRVIAELNQGQRNIFEYLLAPVRKAVYDSGRER